MNTLCVDFDGVIHSYESGWKGADVILDPPVPGAFDWLEEIMDDYEICIYSSRSRQEGGIQAMKEWFAINGLPPAVLEVLKFPTEKPAAYLTIDDRAICFRGTFPSYQEMDNFRPWNKHYQ